MQDLQRMGRLHQEYLGLLAKEGSVMPSNEHIEIDKSDVLVVVDMQNDFLPAEKGNERGGRFGVPEGAEMVPLVEQLIDRFLESGARVVATRDYHPIDHVSFITQGGPFPPHCVQGAYGSKLCPGVAAALRRGVEKYGKDRVVVAFKGFHEDIDSFGAFIYGKDHVESGRLQKREGKEGKRKSGCGLVHWTGCHVLKASALTFDGEIDVNAPPDVLATCSSISLAKYLGPCRNAYFCGLAMDYCVIDSAITGAEQRELFSAVKIVVDATRSAHIGGVGKHGSGFLTSPREMHEKMARHRIRFVSTESLTHAKLEERVVKSEEESAGFPETLGPLALRPIPTSRSIEISLDALTFTINAPGREFCGRKGKISSGTPHFLYPITDTTTLTDHERTHYLEGSFDPKWELAVNGGFFLETEEGGAYHAVSTVPSRGTTPVHFSEKCSFRSSFASALYAADAFNRISLPTLLEKGYHYFTWLGESQVITNDSGEKWCDWPNGAFVYLNGPEDFDSCIMFKVRDRPVRDTIRGE